MTHAMTHCTYQCAKWRLTNQKPPKIGNKKRMTRNNEMHINMTLQQLSDRSGISVATLHRYRRAGCEAVAERDVDGIHRWRERYMDSDKANRADVDPSEWRGWLAHKMGCLECLIAGYQFIVVKGEATPASHSAIREIAQCFLADLNGKLSEFAQVEWTRFYAAWKEFADATMAEESQTEQAEQTE